MTREIASMVQSLSAREVYQVLKDIALGVRTLQSVSRFAADCLIVETDGWGLYFYRVGDSLDYCQSCVAPDGRRASAEDWHRYGTHPLELLSTWERTQLERELILALQAQGI